MKTTFTLIPSSLLRAGLFIGLLVLLNVGQALATTYTFSGTGNWNATGNWSPSYPGTNVDIGNDVIIDGSCTVNVTVYFDGPITINNSRTLTIASHVEVYASLTNNGTIQVNNQLQIYGTFIHNGTSASISGSLYNAGTITVNAGKNLTINQGAYYYHDDGTITSDGNFVSNGNIRIFSGDLTVSDWFECNSCYIEISSGAFIVDVTFSLNGSISNFGTVTINAGKTLTMNGPFDDFGYTDISGTLLANESFYSESSVTINSGGALTFNYTSARINDGSTLTNDGTVTVNAGKNLTVNGTFTNNNTFNHNGILDGTGIIDGSAGLSNSSGGTVAPGSSPGCLTFGSGLTNDGTLEIELADGTACNNYDQINVTGDVTLNGIINISFVNGITPTSSTFTILTATGTKSGTPTITWPAGYSGSGTFVGNEFQVSFSLLPVEMVYFRAASPDDEAVELNWRTASELNNEGFDIERSNDGRHWETLGFVPGHGTTQAEQSYAFTDERPLPGVNYYRLRQVDFDGKMEYSDIRSVMMEGSANGIAVYPNPVKDGLLNVDFAAEQEGTATLRIFDASGKLLHREVLANQHNQTNYG
ncbi:MAG: hypothetical protein K9J45_23210, partial [Bacteroidales bacterium]|nr:hypothetical protein [Bacteroidales bacterium]